MTQDPRFPSDEELIRRAIQSSCTPSPRGGHMRGQAVMMTIGIGSTFAMQLCHRFGLDPDQKLRL